MITVVDKTPFKASNEFGLEKLVVLSLAYEISLTLEIDEILEEQAYRIACEGNELTISGKDASGILYGLLDLTEVLPNGIENIQNRTVAPYIKNRGIKFNIPLDARTPSYSDASDSAAQNIGAMWDWEFWVLFIDKMAEAKFNVLSLWSLSPFPSLVSIPEYPLTALSDVMGSSVIPHATLQGRNMYTPEVEKGLYLIKAISIQEKIKFWNAVIAYAKKRCIKVLLFTWNLFSYGTEKTPYGITADQTNSITVDYLYCGVKALLRTYPELAGIGITAGENMIGDSSDLEFLAKTYGRAVKEIRAESPDRDILFIQRMQMTRYEDIVKNLDSLSIPYGISFKYSQAHMFSSVKPPFIEGFLEQKANDIPIWLTVRNDDYYMHRWGDPEFAYEYLKNMPVSQMAGYYLGADGYTWGRDYLDIQNESHYQYIEKMWYLFSIWGKLSYQIDLDRNRFIGEIGLRFNISGKEAQTTASAWSNASRIFPILNSVHWHDFDFQWYPEACCTYDQIEDKVVFADINEFIACPTIGDGKYVSVQEYCDGKSGTLNPLDAASEIMLCAERALKAVQSLEIEQDKSSDFGSTMQDINTMSILGRYYAHKLTAAVLLREFSISGNKDKKFLAVEHLKDAYEDWIAYSQQISSTYRPQVLTRFVHLIDVSDFDALVKEDIRLASNYGG